MKIEATYDDSEARAMLRLLGDRAPDLCSRVLEQAAEWVIAESQDKYLNAAAGDTAHLHSRTGRLSSSVRWWHDGKLAVLVGTGIVYAAIHEFGGTIVPKTKKYLHFKGAQGWRFAKQVNMPARPYLAPSLQSLWQTGALERLATAEMERGARDAQRQAGGS